jgi:uncharacterized protein YfaS (alpha-2-macroglobulin family)
MVCAVGCADEGDITAMTIWIRAALAFCLIFLSALPTFAAPKQPAVVAKPNLDLYVYRRSYAPGEKVQVRLSGYNLAAVQMTAYRMNLPAVVKTSAGLTDFGKTLKTVNIGALPTAATWRFPLGKTYPDQWAERAVTLPTLKPGVYLISARAGGVEKRTWLAITGAALLVKRSREEILVFATNATSGKPLAGLALSVYGLHGRTGRLVTDANGVGREPMSSPDPVWLYGEGGGSPEFALAAQPEAPDPYTVYPFTDRPIYRPGQTVSYKIIIRKRLSLPSPGGMHYAVYAEKPALVEIRDGTDALVSRQTMTTNADGSVAGTIALAAETTLGSWQIVVTLDGQPYYGSFSVEAYRKPEMTLNVDFEKARYLNGGKVPVTITAAYYYGQPVTHASVTYHIQFDGGDAEPSYDGQGVTDANGKLHLDIQTQRRTSDRTLSVSATVTDLSRRNQSGANSTLIAAGLFHLSLDTDKTVYRAGKQAVVTVTASDYDGKAVAAKVRVVLTETKFDRLNRSYKLTTTREVLTGPTGKVTTTFALPRPGTLDLTATATDSEDNQIITDGSIQVAGDDYVAYAYPTLELTTGRSEYAPGDTATITLNTSLVRKQAIPATKNHPAQPARPDAWALVTVEGERLGQQQVIHLTGPSALIKIPLTVQDFPSVSVNVAIIQDHQVYEQQQRLPVLRRDQKLTVSVATDKARYKPGETAAYTVTTRNYLGQPVPAEVSLGVVDASIYAIAEDPAPDMEGFFYSGQEVRINTEFSFAAQYSGGAYQTIPSPVGGLPGVNIRVRKTFADTAYWNPFVETGTDGTAHVSFELPDNLTTWRATARGVTQNTAVGSATQEVVATMPLVVRLVLPRFYVQGDQAVVSAIVQNFSGASRTVHVRIDPHGATLTGDQDQTVTLDAGGQTRLTWQATITDLPTVRFLVVADGGADGARDATETALPVTPPGLEQVTASADTLTEMQASQKIDIGSLPPSSTVTLTLAPSLASSLFPALDYLASFPTGNAEETMSSFLPDIAVAHAFKARGVARPANPKLAAQVSLGLQKLYRYQHSDGGWNWWEFDQTDGDMTAYVLSGLAEARRAGYLVDAQRLLRGTQALERLVAGENDLGRRADWLLILAQISLKDTTKPLLELYAKHDHLDTYGQASLCLAFAEMGGAKNVTLAQSLAKTLEARAKTQGRLTFWTDDAGGYSWRDDNAAVTAHVLRALLATRPNSAVLPSAVRWLMANRQGDAWGTTRTSAEVVLALAKYLETTGELTPNYAARIALDGTTLGSLSATPKNALDAPLTVTLTPAQLAGHTQITVDKNGPGTLYLSRTVTSLLPPALAVPQSHGITVHRQFQVTADDPSKADTVASGTDIDVSVDITADADYRYVQLEDPIPAGCEVTGSAGDNNSNDSYPVDFSDGSLGYTRQEIRDNRVVFFFDSLPKGLTQVTYHLHAETPGSYQVLPGIASLTYFPEIRGNSGLVKTNIGERP